MRKNEVIAAIEKIYQEFLTKYGIGEKIQQDAVDWLEKQLDDLIGRERKGANTT